VTAVAVLIRKTYDHDFLGAISYNVLEGAPEIRRKKAASSHGGSESSKGMRNSDASLLASPTLDRSESEGRDGDHPLPKHHHSSSTNNRFQVLRSTKAEDDYAGADLSDALFIRPSMILIGKPNDPAISLAVDQLGAHEREIYLRDFFPPNPTVRGNRKSFLPGVNETGSVHHRNKETMEKVCNNGSWGQSTVGI
jgi:hypothetical protein